MYDYKRYREAFCAQRDHEWNILSITTIYSYSLNGQVGSQVVRKEFPKSFL